MIPVTSARAMSAASRPTPRTKIANENKFILAALDGWHFRPHTQGCGNRYNLGGQGMGPPISCFVRNDTMVVTSFSRAIIYTKVLGVEFVLLTDSSMFEQDTAISSAHRSGRWNASQKFQICLKGDRQTASRWSRPASPRSLSDAKADVSCAAVSLENPEQSWLARRRNAWCFPTLSSAVILDDLIRSAWMEAGKLLGECSRSSARRSEWKVPGSTRLICRRSSAGCRMTMSRGLPTFFSRLTTRIERSSCSAMAAAPRWPRTLPAILARGSRPFRVRVESGVRRLRILSLTDNVPMISAWANDASYEDVFARQLENFIRPGDIAFGLSGSGNSPNILKALRLAREKRGVTVGFSGQGGEMIGLLDYAAVVPSRQMQLVEDCQLIMMHMIFLNLRARLADARILREPAPKSFGT